MRPLSLADLRLYPSHHLSALWWLGLLFRRPRPVDEALKALPRSRAIAGGLILFLHALPWLALTAALGRLVLFVMLGLEPASPASLKGGLSAFVWHLQQIAFGIAVGIAFGIAVGIAVGIAGGIAVGIASLRAYYLLAHPFFVWPMPRGRAYPGHPVAWDDLCSIRFPGLSRLLVAYAENRPAAAATEIKRLIDSYPSQRVEALRARALLVARTVASTADLGTIDTAVADLPAGSEDYLIDVPRLRMMVAGIAQAQRQLDLAQVPAYRAPLAAGLVADIHTFRNQAVGLRWPLNEGFRKAADAWLVIAERQRAEAQRVLDTAPVSQVFRAGDPVDRGREAFVPRLPIIEELQGQITLATGCPGILLYGRRRMGKSTLLRNLAPFLPPSIGVVSLSMQDPRAFASLSGLVGHLADIMWPAVLWTSVTAPAPSVRYEGVISIVGEMRAPVSTLSELFSQLDAIDAELAKADRRLIVAIDEYENIDVKIGEGVFPRDLLDAFRESIQRHRRIVWLFAGSTQIAELRHAEWPSYFVSLRTIEIQPFTTDETRLLLTEPMQRSDLWSRDDLARPRFGPSFWGEGGMERIHAEAAGWPHLVQLLAEGVVELVNLRGLRTASPALLDEAITKAVVRGDAVLRQLVRNESRLPGEWDFLSAFRRTEAQPPPTDEAVYTSLRRRLMVVEEGGLWRMRVPLMQRWLRERG